MLRHLASSFSRTNTLVPGEPTLAPGTQYSHWAGELNFAAFPRQGSLGNCWLMAPMLAVYLSNPTFFRSAINYLPGEPRALVRIFQAGKSEWIPLTMNFPVNTSGHFIYATESGGGPGWAGMLEKALAVRLASSYPWLSRGIATLGFPALTGAAASLRVPTPSLADFARWHAEGRPAVVSSHPLSPALSRRFASGTSGSFPRVPANHVMAVAGVDKDAGELLVRNPWTPDTVLHFPEYAIRTLFISADLLDRSVL